MSVNQNYIPIAMARNEEKSQSMLHRYLRSKGKRERSEKRRPYLATLCDDVDEAERWHEQVLQDIRRRVEEIQNPGLEEARTRELNDAINKLLRERGHWERRISVLGGTNYRQKRRLGGKDDVSNGVFHHRGYFYFGEARNLPGVKELITAERDTNHGEKDSTEDESPDFLYRKASVQYYGYQDEDDLKLRAEEATVEQNLMVEMVRDWEQKNIDSGEHAAWDDTYLQFVGKRPTISGEAATEALALERKRIEALEQLEGGLIGKR